jgi:hypothetical protein
MQSKDYQYLRKCPFCKAQPISEDNRRFFLKHNPECFLADPLHNADFHIVSTGFITDHIKAWNTRPIEDEKDQEIEGLKVELDNLRNFCDSILEMAKRNNGVLYFRQDSGTWKIETGKGNNALANATDIVVGSIEEKK